MFELILASKRGGKDDYAGGERRAHLSIRLREPGPSGQGSAPPDSLRGKIM